nr:MAG TPA: hypothetical protein [Caudoviricetes sp.]
MCSNYFSHKPIFKSYKSTTKCLLSSVNTLQILNYLKRLTENLCI